MLKLRTAYKSGLSSLVAPQFLKLPSFRKLCSNSEFLYLGISSLARSIGALCGRRGALHLVLFFSRTAAPMFTVLY